MRVLSFVFIVFILFPFSGTSTLAAEAVEIDFWFGETNEIYIDAMNQIVSEFNEAHPSVQVNMTPWDANDVDKLAVAILSGNPPDVAYLAGFTVNVMKLSGGYLTPLNDLMGSEALERLDILPGPTEENAQAGVWYAIPFRTTSSGMYMNADLFGEAGLDPTKGPQDIQALDELADKLTLWGSDGSVERLGFAPRGNNFAVGLPWMWAFGGEFFDYDSSLPTFTGRPENLAAVEWIASYAEKYGPDVSAGSGNFLNQRTAMHVNTSSFVAALQAAENKFNWRISPLPTIPNVDSFSIGFSLAAGIPIGASHPEAAMEFILHLIEPETNVRFFQQTGALPANFAAVQGILNLLDDPRDRVLVELLQNSRALPPFYYPELYNVWNERLQAMRRNEISPPQVLQDTQRLMETIYKDAFSGQ